MMTHDLNILTALVAFATAAGLLTIIPGLDTMLVLRTAIAESRHQRWAQDLAFVQAAWSGVFSFPSV
jgi:threonine/homoserine/homoserine lactone efflux protein